MPDDLRCLAFLICRSVEPHPGQGTCSVHHIFFEGSAPSYPAAISGTFFACLEADSGSRHDIDVLMIDPTELEPVPIIRQTIVWDIIQERQYVSRSFNATIKTPGRYVFQLRAGGAVLAESPLVLRLADSPA